MLSPQKFESMLSNRLQDFLMMVYLGKMTKTQLVIADKINKILPSTVPGQEVKQKEEAIEGREAGLEVEGGEGEVLPTGACPGAETGPSLSLDPSNSSALCNVGIITMLMRANL